MSDLISIITPLFDSQDYIQETILSVQAQTYQNWEMIVIDDCSKDDGVTKVKKISKEDKRIKLIIQKEHSGPAHVRNISIGLAKGRYLAFLDSDDVWHKDKLDKQIKFMQNNEYAFTYTGYEKINEAGGAIGIVTPYRKQVSYYDLLKSNHIGCLTAMLDLKLLGEKVYAPIIRKRQDHGLWLKVLKRVDKAYCLNEILAQYRIRKGSLSTNKITNIKYQWKLYREIEELNIIKSLYYMAFYTYYGIRKFSSLN